MPLPSPLRNYAQRGNILFLILLAIILFVAMNYAVMSQRDGSKNASSEKVGSMTAQILQQAAMVEQTVQRLRVSGGCSDVQLSFANTINSPANYVNPNAPADKHCHVFDALGGGLANPIPPAGSQDLTGRSAWYNVEGYVYNGSDAWVNVGTSAPELGMYLMDIRPEVCEALNVKLGIPMTTISDSDISFGNEFKGVYGTSLRDVGDEAPGVNIRGFYMGCIKEGSRSHFFMVLLAR